MTGIHIPKKKDKRDERTIIIDPEDQSNKRKRSHQIDGLEKEMRLKINQDKKDAKQVEHWLNSLFKNVQNENRS